MADESDPPRRFYKLKPKEFERVNEIASAPADPPVAGNPAAPLPCPPGAIDVRALAREAQAPGGAPLLRSQREAGPANDVHGMLRENLARANAAGANDLAPAPKRKSRRLRDYLLVLIPVNAFFAYVAFCPAANAVTFVCGIAGIAFFTVALTWVMFGIMNKY